MFQEQWVCLTEQASNHISESSVLPNIEPEQNKYMEAMGDTGRH